MEEVTGPLDRPRNPRLGLVGVTLRFIMEMSEMSGRLALLRPTLTRRFSFLSASKVDLFLVLPAPSEKLGV